MNTDRYRTTRKQTKNRTYEQQQWTKIGRHGRGDGHVDDIVAMVAFVAGPEASYITGANLTVDGSLNS